MPVTPHYTAGAITLTPGETTFTLETGALAVNAKEGDLIVVDGQSAVGIIDSITDATEGELLFPWAGDEITPEDDPLPGYVIKHVGPEWFSAVTITVQQSRILERITAGGNLWPTVGKPDADVGYVGDFAIEIAGLSAIIYEKGESGWDDGTTLVGNGVTSGTGVPSDASGQEGDLYIRTSTGDLYLKTSGAWGIIAVITGATGPAGASAAPTWEYTGSTSDADPGAGVVRFNNAIQSVTRIYFSDTLFAGGAFGAAIDTWDDRGDTGNRGSLFVFNPAAAGTWAWFQVTGAVEVASGYRKVNVTRIASNPTTGAIAPTGTKLSFLFIPAGLTGLTGAAGVTPGKRFVLDTSTTSGDPGDGRIRLNHAVFGSVTAVLIDDLDAAGANAEPWIQAMGASNHAVRSVLTFQDPAAATDMTFAVTGAPSDLTGHWSVPVDPLSGTIPADASLVTAVFAPSGDDGVDGTDGEQGLPGPASAPMAIVYEYDDATADEDPGSGNIRFNNVDWSLATAMYLDNLSYAGASVSSWIDSWQLSGSATEVGTVLIMDVENPANYLVGKLPAGIVDGSGYRKVSLFNVIAGGTPAAGAQLGVLFIPAAATSVPTRLGASGATVSDWDSVVSNGWYVGIDAENAPEVGTFIGYVERDTAATYVVQRLRPVGATEDDLGMWERARIASVWGEWYRVLSSHAEIVAAAGGAGGFNVRNFEAQGDGDADDTEAIQAALDAAGPTKATIFVPPGTYNHTTLTLPAGCELVLANGAVLNHTVYNENGIVMEAGSTLRGGTIRSPETWDGTNVQWTYAVVFVDGDDCTIDDVRFENIPRVGIGFNDTSLGLVQGCRFYANYPEEDWTGVETVNFGIGINPGGGDTDGLINITGNIFRSSVQGVFIGNYGIGGAGRGINVAANVFDGCWNHGVYGATGHGYTVTGNSFANCQVPVAITGKRHSVVGNSMRTTGTGAESDLTGISVRDAQGCAIIGNTIEGDAFDTQVIIDVREFNGTTCVDNVVAHNTIKTVGGSSIAIRVGGGTATAFSGNIVQGNTIRGNGRPGLGLISVVGKSGDQGYGNKVLDNAVFMEGETHGIYVSQVVDTDVRGNYVRLDYNAPSAKVLGGVFMTGSAVRTTIRDNTFVVPASAGTDVTFRAIWENSTSSPVNGRYGRNTFALDPTLLTAGVNFLLQAAGGAVIEDPREVLIANRTYYVRTDGSDSNNGLSNTSGGAFLTLQKAMDVIAAFDISTFNVTVNVGAGTYTSILTLKTVVGSGTVSFIGDEATPGNVHINVTGNRAIFGGTAVGTTFVIAGFKVTSSSTQDIRINSTCRVTLRNIEYAGTSNYRLNVGSKADVIIAGTNNKISGGGIGFLLSEGHGYTEMISTTLTVTADLTYSGAFVTARNMGLIVYSSLTISLGSFTVTGVRHAVSLNGVINGGGGATFFPGDSAGTTASGGQYGT